MALPSSGAISLSDVNVELGKSATATISMNDSDLRGLFGLASGAVDMASGRGKSNQFSLTISTNQTNADMATVATAAGWDGSSKLVVTINSGVILSSNSTSVAGLTVSGSFPGGLEITNNGVIVGRGGNGGGSHSVGGVGGDALSVSAACTFTNNGTLAAGGGGGGGGSSSRAYPYDNGPAYGGGGGGGRSSLTNSASNGNGNAGTYNAAGNGGGGNNSYWTDGYGGSFSINGGNGGAGGTWGAGGGSGNYAGYKYNNQSNLGLGAAGGASGKAVSGNSYITWGATGTRLGAIV